MQTIGDDFTREDAIKALSSSVNEAALVANLQYFGGRGEVVAMELGYGDAIAKHLSHSSPLVAAAACEACGAMGSAGLKYADLVAAALGNESLKVRVAAAAALGAFGPDAARFSEKLASAITSAAEEQVKVVAIQALGMIGAKDQSVLVTGLLADKSPDVQGAACLALSGMGEAGTSLAKDIATKLGTDGTRYSAICALAAMGDEVCKPFVGDIISKCVADPDMQTRSEALAVLARLPGDTAAAGGALAGLLKDKSPAVRAAAALCLGNCGEPAASHASAVAELLQDEEEDESWLPLQIGGGSTRAPMAMRKPKCAALVALGAMKSDAQLSDVGKFTSDGDWEVRFCAVEALGVYGKAAKDLADKIVDLLDDDTYPVRAKACFALGACGAEEQVDRLSEMLTDQTQSVRSEAATALGALGEAANQYTGELAKLLSDTSSPVRAAAAGALGSLGDGGKPYASVIASLLYDADPSVVAGACTALGKMDAYGAAFAEDVAWFLEFPVPQVRAAAATALGQMGTEGLEYSRELRMLEGDPDESVAKAAKGAVAALTAIEN